MFVRQINEKLDRYKEREREIEMDRQREKDSEIYRKDASLRTMIV